MTVVRRAALSVLTLQAKAVVQLEADESLRQCLRKVA